MKMSDLIDRQAAIDALDTGCELLRRTLDDTDVVGVERAKYEWGLGLIESYIADIKELPSTQPEIIYCKDCKHFIRDDITEYTCYGFYNEYFSAFCDKHWNKDVGEYEDAYLDGFCSYAERRQDD